MRFPPDTSSWKLASVSRRRAITLPAPHAASFLAKPRRFESRITSPCASKDNRSVQTKGFVLLGNSEYLWRLLQEDLKPFATNIREMEISHLCLTSMESCLIRYRECLLNCWPRFNSLKCRTRLFKLARYSEHLGWIISILILIILPFRHSHLLHNVKKILPNKLNYILIIHIIIYFINLIWGGGNILHVISFTKN